MLSGILNGVDRSVWNPATDAPIAQRYDADRHLARKARQQGGAAARARAGHADTDALLFGIVSRLTEQKGLRLVLAALPELLARGGQLVVLGSGDAELEAAFRAAAERHPSAVACASAMTKRCRTASSPAPT